MKKKGAKRKIWELAENVAGALITQIFSGIQKKPKEHTKGLKKWKKDFSNYRKDAVVLKNVPPTRQQVRRSEFLAQKRARKTAERERQRSVTIKGRAAAREKEAQA